MEEIKTEKSVLYKHLSLYHDHNSSSNLSQRAIAHEIFEPFFTIGRAMRTIKEAIKEIKDYDSKTALTERGLRRLVKENKIPVVDIGNKALIDMENLYAYLSGKNKI